MALEPGSHWSCHACAHLNPATRNHAVRANMGPAGTCLWLWAHRRPAAVHIKVLPSVGCAQVVAETLKMLLVSLTIAAQLAPDAQSPLLALFLPLLIEAAAPEAAPRTPALADVAVKLITHLASGPCAAEFRQSLAALPPAAKQRLQVSHHCCTCEHLVQKHVAQAPSSQAQAKPDHCKVQYSTTSVQEVTSSAPYICMRLGIEVLCAMTGCAEGSHASGWRWSTATGV